MASAHSSKLIYDPCSYEQDLKRSTDPLMYQLYGGKYYNCNYCHPDQMRVIPDPHELVDIESELRNLTRINSRCTSQKYPNCDGGACIGTYDQRLPNYISPWACDRLVPSNIMMPTHPGFNVPNTDVCTMPTPGFTGGVQPTHYYYST